ncbi:MAG: NPCBM/NEW2 domain-containing protein [Verrucomicrobiales bacterium]
MKDKRLLRRIRFSPLALTSRIPAWLLLSACVSLVVPEAAGWGKRGHGLIRAWAVERLPEWQRERIGEESLANLATAYTSLQDQHAGKKAPHLDPYCVVPGLRLSLHDVNPAEPSIEVTRWYIARIAESLAAGEADEAMKFLGVLCHWNEDPGVPSAHSSPISEADLRILLPRSPEKENLNYLYGYGGIADPSHARYEIPDEDYRPRLLGADEREAAARIFHHQRLLERGAASDIVPLVQAVLTDDAEAADRVRARAALRNARHVADLVHTVLCLAEDRIEPSEASALAEQPLDAWLPDFEGGRTAHPYYVTPFLVGQAMDAERALHPLAFPGEEPEAEVERGFGMGAPFALSFPVAPGGLYERFTCRVGLHPAAGETGEIEFVIEVNGESLHATGPLRAGDPPEAIEVDLPARDFVTLTLRTVAGEGADPLHNLAVWAEPLLHRAEGAE